MYISKSSVVGSTSTNLLNNLLWPFSHNVVKYTIIVSGIIGTQHTFSSFKPKMYIPKPYQHFQFQFCRASSNSTLIREGLFSSYLSPYAAQRKIKKQKKQKKKTTKNKQTKKARKKHLFIASGRLAPILKTSFHQCVISYTCSHSNSDHSVLQSHQS